MSKLWCFILACTRECFWKGLKPSLFSSHDKCPRSSLPHHCIVWHDLMSCCEVPATPPTLQTDNKHGLVFATGCAIHSDICLLFCIWKKTPNLSEAVGAFTCSVAPLVIHIPARVIRESSSLIVCLQVSLWFLNISAAHFCTNWAASTADNEHSLLDLESQSHHWL